ncbi:hypothetical protein DTO271D3_5644 [Paecilomyces variotii]|nr:hypothetical protein DTO166G5_4667 [Paecilomyces variotii]KAJ9243547.1 hypothetical protein DTO169E5_2790 [Paecilomyces variotii]KAJ9314167.1 hypothetical protein DTO271D3_5644 [Paecilomyces variotii]KAJ9326970.1 hypothetical protein DTO027B3_2210 [Paecilomyces variotii]KAJ9332605.1 hypothetical protein DTO027B5_5568 [Paecilomyces variotii]
MASYNLLDQAEEDALHKSRLLNVEEKPFKRITKRLLTPGSLTSSLTTILPTPPPDNADDDAATALEAERQKKLEEWRQFREDVTLDFAAFEGSIARIQFLLTSNEKERERYAAQKLRIQSTAQSVSDNITELRTQLEEAQRTLALRKTYDELAEKITSNRLLKPREDQENNLQKLQAEITELEKESKEYAKTWSERREQFGRIVEEGMQLRRLIRDEKEEVERREGMQEGEDGDEGDVPSKDKTSGSNTPRPENTPLQSSREEHGSSGLQVDRSHDGTARASPLRQTTNMEQDTNMVDEGEVTGDEGTEKANDLEEGEEVSDGRVGDKMDTT